MYRTVGQLLQAKGNQAWTVKPETTVYEALVLMVDKNIGAVIVANEQGKLVGIFSERDCARKVILNGRDSRSTKVEDLMSRDVLCVNPQEELEHCMAVMTNKRVRHLPVLDEGKVAGLISIGDVVKAIISDREFTIEQLQSYITGR